MDADDWILIVFGYLAVNVVMWVTQKFWSRK